MEQCSQIFNRPYSTSEHSCIQQYGIWTLCSTHLCILFKLRDN